MKRITRSELAKLAEPAGNHVVSIYMPLYTGAECRQNLVRLNNMLRTAEGKLLDVGMRRPDVEKRLAQADKIIEQAAIWEELSQGLAVFIDGSGARAWQLPFRCDERCVVGSDPYLLPLAQWLSDDASYYVLAVSQNAVRMLRGNRGEIEEVDVPDMPANRDEALNLDQPEPAMQAHMGRQQVPGKGDLMYHGHGGAPDAAKDELRAFLRVIDRAVSGFLALQSEPLVFAGVEYLFPIYEEVNSYAHLLPTRITGNPELWSNAELQQKAWPLVEPLIAERREIEISRFGEFKARGRASDRLEEILVAAHAGAVELLLIDPHASQPGKFDANTQDVRFDESPEADSEDLVNLAANLVLRSSGTVETLESAHVPGGGPVAATTRYEYAPLLTTAGKPMGPRRKTAKSNR